MFVEKIVCLVLLLTVLVFPQSFDIDCGTNESYSSLDQTQRGGRWLTASGELKVLVVFAKFQGDTEDHPFGLLMVSQKRWGLLSIQINKQIRHTFLT